MKEKIIKRLNYTIGQLDHASNKRTDRDRVLKLSTRKKVYEEIIKDYL